jgi:hypothetical protein
MSHELIRFENKALRKIWHEGEWYFSVVDVIEVLTDGPIPRNYWNILKKREPQLHTICMQLKLTAQDGRMRKGLERENLRDHMTPLELIFTALSEEITRKLSIKEDAQGFAENHETAQEGSQITGRFRQETEAKLGEKVVSSQNFLNLNKKEELSNDEL